MAKPDLLRQQIKAKISAIKKINDNPKSLVNSVFAPYKDDLSSTDGIVKKGINDFTSKLKGGTQNKKDIFAEIIDLGEGFLGVKKEDPINPSKKPLIKSKMLSYAKQAAARTVQQGSQILSNEMKKSFFSGQGACNSSTTFQLTGLTLSPKSFDFVNMLKVSPTSTSGKIMYENPIDLGLGEVKFNRKLYENFDLPTPPYLFQTKAGSTLFNLAWSGSTQVYSISGLSSSLRITDFIDQYYNTIERPHIDDVMKNAMLMTIQGDGTESVAFNKGMNNLNRLATKLFCLCGSPTNTQPLLNNTPQQLTEDETDVQDYFNFDDVEGIDLDDEDARNRRVLKFTDCNNFEIPTNPNHIEDFAYLTDTKPLDENINNTLNKLASDAYEQSGGANSAINFDGFQLSAIGSYILKVPKAIVSSILSPKMIFPIALTYKEINGTDISINDLMKIMSNMFFNIIKNIFWTFIKEFWGFLKKDLLNFIKETANTIILNQLKKLKSIISILINIIKQVLQGGIQSCTEIFNAILTAINAALNKKISVPIPGLLLSLSDKLPGYSSDRAYMNSMEKMEAAGINTGPIFGTENKFPSVIKAILDGHSEEMDTNSYVSIGLKSTIIPSGPGGAVITPLVMGAGKLF